jgi:hypothetical protein
MCFAREHTSELTYVMAMRDGTADVALPHSLPIRGIFGRLFRRACGATPRRSAFLLLEAVDFVPDRLMGSRVASHHRRNDGGTVVRV